MPYMQPIGAQYPMHSRDPDDWMQCEVEDCENMLEWLHGANRWEQCDEHPTGWDDWRYLDTDEPVPDHTDEVGCIYNEVLDKEIHGIACEHPTCSDCGTLIVDGECSECI